MPYTYKALAWAWLVIIGLFALSGSGVVTGSWFALLLVAALGAPVIWTLCTKPSGTVRATAPSRGRVSVNPDLRDRSQLEASAPDVYRWENDGGARRAPFGGGLPGQ
ncbi:MAG TPA: hypothetical protein VK886_19270 [Vicinamibacterales bacterium]|nr:hypothetical protein [Vicinamibacterales bacterium]